MFRIINPDVEVLKGIASGIIQGEPGAYTETMFYEDCPQFRDASKTEITGFVPTSMMNVFLKMCNDAVAPARWGEMWRLAASLYVAHFASLWLKNTQGNTNGSATASDAAESGTMTGILSGASLGDASVSYDTSAITEATHAWGQWNLTSYGQQFASMARLVAIGGGYVI